MRPGRAEVGRPPIVADLDLQSLVLAAPDVGQPDPVSTGGRGGVEVDRQVEAAGDPGPEGAGQLDALVERRVAEGDERDHVDGPDPGVLASLQLHVDLADGDLDGLLHRPDHRLRLAGQGQDGAVVAGVARPVEEQSARRSGDGRGKTVDDLNPAAFGEVRHTLDQLGHALHRATSAALPTPACAGRRSTRGALD